MKIAICTSMQFTEQMLAAQKQLEAQGHTVFVSGFSQEYVGKNDEQIEALKLKHKFEFDAIREFWLKIKMSDAILVLNYDKKGIKNYIGCNTLMEIGFAHILNKKIFLLNPIPDIDFYKSEIEATKPIILNGNLSNLK